MCFFIPLKIEIFPLQHPFSFPLMSSIFLPPPVGFFNLTPACLFSPSLQSLPLFQTPPPSDQFVALFFPESLLPPPACIFARSFPDKKIPFWNA